MEQALEILKLSGLGLLGILLYALVSVRKQIWKDKYISRKLLTDNIPFWILSFALNVLLVIMVTIAPDIKGAFSFFVSIEDGKLGGFMILGYGLAKGTDFTAITGDKQLKTKSPTET